MLKKEKKKQENIEYGTEEVLEMLRQSNYIEKEYSEKALADSFKAWKYLEKKKTIALKDILEIHKIMLKGLDPSIAGKIRNCDVWIGGKRKMFISIQLLEDELNNWLKVSDTSKIQVYDERSKNKMIMNWHVMYEHIHPFIDGNGRTGRLLMNWQRMRSNLPINIIKESEKMEYYKLFKN